MFRISLVICTVLALLPACGSSDGGGAPPGPTLEALSFTVSRVAMAGDVLSVGTFDGHGFNDDPAIGDGGVLASEVDVDGVDGLLIYDGTNYHLHAKQGDPRPGGGTWPGVTSNAVVNGGTTSFSISGGLGIYSVPNDGSASPSVLVDTSTVVRDTAGNPLAGSPTFTGFGEHGRSGTLTLFEGERNNGSDIEGLYLDDNGTLTLLFEEGDSLALLGGTVTSIAEPHVRQGAWCVQVSTTGASGFIANFGTGPEVVVDDTQPVPSGLGSFTGFGEISLDGARAAFQASNDTGIGVYVFDRDTSTLVTIADQTVPAPGTAQTFDGAYDPSIAGDYVIFEGFAPDKGIYLCNLRDGGIHPVLKIGDTLEGKTVSNINHRISYTIDGNRIGLAVSFDDSTTGLYIVEIGTP